MAEATAPTTSAGTGTYIARHKCGKIVAAAHHDHDPSWLRELAKYTRDWQRRGYEVEYTTAKLEAGDFCRCFRKPKPEPDLFEEAAHV